jgi:hypothetical protein
MDEHGDPHAEAAPDREELGISTGLIEWFQSAPWVIKGRLVRKPRGQDGEDRPRTRLSRFQVELPSRRWFMEGIGQADSDDPKAG